MHDSKVAIFGLEKCGELLLEGLIKSGHESTHIVCAVSFENSPGQARAEARGVALVDTEKLVRLSDDIDVICDLSGDPGLAKILHDAMAERGNHHTQLLSGDAFELIRLLGLGAAEKSSPDRRIAISEVRNEPPSSSSRRMSG